jgi:2-methylcitrate dehydratase PrpD
MDAQELSRVADWATSVTPAEIPAASISAARRIFFDDIAAILAGHRDSEVQAAVEGWSLAPGRSSVLRPGGGTADAWSAAEVNGLAGCWLELDGGFRLNTAHAGLYTVPTVLAMAEERDLPLGETLTAMIIGYEVAARIVTRWNISAANSHGHGTVSAAAAAAAAGRILGLDRDRWILGVTSAVTLSTLAPFDHAFAGAIVRNLWAAVGNRTGQLAAHAARTGVGGLPDSIDMTYGGVLRAPRWEGAQLPEELGTAVQHSFQKLYSCCAYLHSSVEAVLELQAESTIDPDEIVRISADIHRLGIPLNDPVPPTTLGARFSAPHAIAATLVKGSAMPESFSVETLTETRIAALRGLVEMKEIAREGRDPALRDAEVSIELADGSRLTRYVEVAIGDPNRPLTLDQLKEKASLVAGGGDVEPLAAALIDAPLDSPASDLTAALQGLLA